MDVEEVDRETLYEQVWKEPMTKVAERYGVSSSYLSRVCKNLGVPKPERGHWAKIAAGKKVHVPKLPAPRPEHDLYWTTSGYPQPERNTVTPEPYKHSGTRPKNKKLAEIPSIHPLVRNVRELFLKAWDTGNGYLKPRKWNLVDIITSEKSLDRALQIANTIFLEFYRRSWAMKLEAYNFRFSRPTVDDRPNGGPERYSVSHWSPGRPTILYVGTVAIGLTLIEDSEPTEMARIDGEFLPVSVLSKKQVASHWTSRVDYPSGRFRLRAYSPYNGTTWQREWPIREDQDLSKLARKVAVELTKATSEIAEQYAAASDKARKARQEREEQLERMRIAEEERLRAEALAKSTEALESLISEWGKAKAMEGFFSQLQEKVETAPEHDKAHLVGRLEEARTLMRAPDVLQILKDWQTPEERYEARKKSKSRF